MLPLAEINRAALTQPHHKWIFLALQVATTNPTQQTVMGKTSMYKILFRYSVQVTKFYLKLEQKLQALKRPW